MVLETYPLDNVDYSAEDAELFHCTRSSGIYANDDFDYSVTGADNTITIGVGLGWIRNSRFSGKVVALKAAMALDMGLPDAVYPRIDAVVIQFDANKNGTEIVVKRGVSASAPAAPAISRTESLYELHLYHVRREPGASAVSVSNITDLRLDPNCCGLMADSVTQIDTAAISAQVNALIENLRQEIQSVKDGSAYLMRSGGTMSGPINMNGQALKGLKAPTEDDEAVNWGSVKNAAGVGIPLPLGLEYGGVGATDPKTARENLEITPENIGAEPAGAMRMELLWENASITSNFDAQDIVIPQLINANDDSFLGLVYDGQVGIGQWGLAFVKVSTLKTKPVMWLKTAVDLNLHRTLNIDFATGKIAIGSGYNGSSANGGFCVPVNIFLVKGAST